MRIDIYVGKILYKSTHSVDEAFDTFQMWTGTGLNVRMRFIHLQSKVA